MTGDPARNSNGQNPGTGGHNAPSSEKPGRSGVWRWHFAAGVSATTQAFWQTADWRDWLEHPAIRIVKPGERRTVIRIAATDESPPVYCKRFLNVGWADHARTLLRGSPARWENSRIQLALSRGLPTAEVLGYGERCIGPLTVESRLFLAAIEPVISLAEMCAPAEFPDVVPPASAQIPQGTWVPAVARLLAQMHGRGLWHGDLHGGNVLLQTSSSSAQPWIIDLAAIRGGSHCPKTQIINNLARFWLSIERAWTATDREEFIRDYWFELQKHDSGLAHRLGTSVPAATQELLTATQRAVAPIHHQADQAWQRGGRRVWITSRGRALRSLGESWIQTAMSHCDQWWTQSTPIATTDQCDIRRWTGPTPWGTRSLRMWRFQHSKVKGSWSPGRRAWENGHALHRRGVVVAVPWLLYAEGQTEFLIACEPLGSMPCPKLQENDERCRALSEQIRAAGFSIDPTAIDAMRTSSDGQTLAWCALESLHRQA
ncbi:hypothetical protein GC163_14015 [bacterium]|nr:hypothetical protein [bacterium]